MESSRHVPIWGGFECTVNRVGDRYFDQIVRTGHQDRIEDLKILSDLGARCVRYPVLWERVSPEEGRYDWEWTDARLAELRERGIQPILGLLHHGSGPRYTSLVDPRFPEKLATYARAVAERYPWAEMYTPVNEPLTTARFSCLYGHWYPHLKGDKPFSRALLNQLRGTVLAMRAIREVCPDAQLVQTEDLGKTHSTRPLAYQARFENERRWVTFDLLAGRLSPRHKMYRFLRYLDVPAADLDWFLENPCPPDILGINYYVTSERYLDHRIDRYPRSVVGGNGRHRYADVEAVRARVHGIAGPKKLLREAWERHGIPLAITEAHLGCTREEQVRWFTNTHRQACALAGEGVDVRGVTAWALLGSYDWDSLITKDRGHYESGVYDVRSGEPRPTALVPLIQALSQGEPHEHPIHQEAGWWARPVRYEHPEKREAKSVRIRRARPGTAPLLITGESGTLGGAFARLCELRGLPYVLTSRARIDVANCNSVYSALRRFKPWAVVNTAGYVRVDDAEADSTACYRANARGPQILAEACGEMDIQFLTFSSDLVFDGSKKAPYVETDHVRPLNIYGKSKALGERLVFGALPNALVLRTSAFFGPWDEHNFLVHMLRTLSRGEVYLASNDTVSPTYVPDLVNVALDLLLDRERGIWHAANEGATTWVRLARRVADRFGLDSSLILGANPEELGWAAQRPSYSVLGTSRGHMLPRLDRALDKFAESLEVRWEAPATPMNRGLLL